MNVPALASSSQELADIVDRARKLLDEGDVAKALSLSSVAYDQAKAAGDSASRVKASRELVDKARRMQADALTIESMCYVAMADAVDAAQAKGELSRGGRPKTVGHENAFTIEQIGLDRQQVHHARKLRDAVREEPDFVERFVEARLEEGFEPTRRSIRHAIGTRSASKEDKGDQLYETPAEATRALLALESFSATFKEPFVGRAAILRVMEDAGYDAVISDLRDREITTKHGELQGVGDFLLSEPGETEGMDIVTNPPYGDDANRCLAHALRVHRPRKMAALLNLNFMCGFDDPDRRFIMDENPPARVYVFTRRLPMMHRDGWDGPKSTSQMNTAWFVWEMNDDGSYGGGRGCWETIRIDWKNFEGREALPPGAGGHVAPMVFRTPDDEFARETVRKTLDERVEEDFTRAFEWMRDRWPEPFDLSTFRKGMGLRESTAAALLDAFHVNGLVEPDGQGMWMPSGAGISMMATVGAVEAVKSWRAGKAVAA